jgi:alpha/beta superfamily hydrolase
MSPRPFERPATIALPDVDGLDAGSALDGLWLPARGEGEARGGAVVAAPHPLMGGSMESPVATEIGLAASDEGFVSLRFNWRGVGASAGSPSCGYSWGALTAARVCLDAPRVQRLVLVAPPPGMLDRDALVACGKPLLVIAGDRDEYVSIDALRKVLDGLPRTELVVLEAVDHFFMSGLADVGHGMRSWLEAKR